MAILCWFWQGFSLACTIVEETLVFQATTTCFSKKTFDENHILILKAAVSFICVKTP